MPEHAVVDPAFAVVEHERHRIILAVDFRTRLGQYLDRGLARQARVKLVDRLELSHCLHSRVLIVGDLDCEPAVGVVPSQFGVPRTPGKLDEFGPLLKRPAGEVDEHKALAALDNAFEVRTRLGSWVGNFPIHKVQHDCVVVA